MLTGPPPKFHGTRDTCRGMESGRSPRHAFEAILRSISASQEAARKHGQQIEVTAVAQQFRCGGPHIEKKYHINDCWTNHRAHLVATLDRRFCAAGHYVTVMNVRPGAEMGCMTNAGDRPGQACASGGPMACVDSRNARIWLLRMCYRSAVSRSTVGRLVRHRVPGRRDRCAATA